MRTILCGLVLLFISQFAFASPGESPACGDFLAAHGIKPAAARYVGCAPDKLADNMRVLAATYTVAGKDLAAIEKWAMQLAHIHRLRRACC